MSHLRPGAQRRQDITAAVKWLQAGVYTCAWKISVAGSRIAPSAQCEDHLQRYSSGDYSPGGRARMVS